jgi:hypothetical protein
MVIGATGEDGVLLAIRRHAEIGIFIHAVPMPGKKGEALPGTPRSALLPRDHALRVAQRGAVGSRGRVRCSSGSQDVINRRNVHVC